MTIPKKKTYPMIYVEWVDSRQGGAEWRYTSEMSKSYAVPCVSVGFLLEETKDAIRMAETLGDVDPDTGEADQYVGGSIITKCAITKRRRLK